MDGPPAKRARSILEELRKQTVEEGEAVLHDLPSAAKELQAQVRDRFSLASMDEVEAEFEALCTPEAIEEAKECPLTKELLRFVRTEVDLACRRFSALEAWLKLKVPKIEDGNNFGVEVQRQVLAVVQDYRNYAWKELCALKSHSWNRAVVSESMEQSITEEHTDVRDGSAGASSATGTGSAARNAAAGEAVRSLNSVVSLDRIDSSGSRSSSCCCKDGSASHPAGMVTKSTHMVRRNTHKMPRLAHYTRYIKELEIEFYFKLRHTARNLAQYYLDLYDMFEKNWEKVLFPRGQAPSCGRLMY